VTLSLQCDERIATMVVLARLTRGVDKCRDSKEIAFCLVYGCAGERTGAKTASVKSDGAGGDWTHVDAVVLEGVPETSRIA